MPFPKFLILDLNGAVNIDHIVSINSHPTAKTTSIQLVNGEEFITDHPITDVLGFIDRLRDDGPTEQDQSPSRDHGSTEQDQSPSRDQSPVVQNSGIKVIISQLNEREEQALRNNGYDIRTFEHASGETVAYVGFLISRNLPTTEEELTRHPMVQCVNAFETIVAALMVQTIDAHVGAQVPEDQTPEDQTPEDQTPDA